MAGPVINFGGRNNRCISCDNSTDSSSSYSLITRRTPTEYHTLHRALGLNKGDKISAHKLAYLSFRARTQDPHLPRIVIAQKNLPHFINYVCYRFLREKAAGSTKPNFESTSEVKNIFELADKLLQDSSIVKTLGGILWMISRSSIFLGGPPNGNVARTEEDAFNSCVVGELAQEVAQELPLKLFSTAAKYDRIAPNCFLEGETNQLNNQLERTAVVNFLCRKILINDDNPNHPVTNGNDNHRLLARNGLVWELVMQRQILLDDLVVEVLKCSENKRFYHLRTRIAHIAIQLIELGGQDVADKFVNFFRKLCKTCTHESAPSFTHFLTLMAEALVKHGKLVEEVAAHKHIHEQLPKVLAALICEYWNFSIPHITSPLIVAIEKVGE